MAKVVVLGGGVAGMSAAHELIERGFEVEVFDTNTEYCGGKARSVNVPDTSNDNPDSALPGEHGFRFFPGFYKHITDTMSRIPFRNEDGKMNKNGVLDNLTPTEMIMIARYDGEPIITSATFPRSLAQLEAVIHVLVGGDDSGLTKEEEHFFTTRVWQLMTSCKERRQNFYEKIGWWEFMEADNFSETYQHLLVDGLTRTLVAAQAKLASTKTGGDIFLQLIFNMMDPFVNADRVLDGPTNQKWLDPWLEFLREKGVTYHLGHTVTEIEVDVANKKISGAVILDQNGNKISATGDIYLLAVPIEVVGKLINPDMVKLDDTFTQLQTLANNVQWMNGMQFFLNEDVTINKGHVIYCDSQWAVTSISHVQFWKGYDITKCYNGKVKGVLSVDISDWFTKGFNGKAASDCNAEEIKNEVWAEIKKSLNQNGTEVLRDDMLEYWYLDHDIIIGSLTDAIDKDREPLLVNYVNTWCLRPPAYTNIPNFFLAGDYVRTFTDLATMEGANESARRAVNCIIDATGTDADDCELWDLHEPLLLAPFRKMDELRWEKGLPWKNPI